jgi:glyoxylase-like metal-dependent hydrolase (beta-lactamase superfamily II)
MKLFAVEGNSVWLDGGSMFGNTPKILWEKWMVPDERNRIKLSCRTLLLQTDDGQNVLFETGIGTFFEPKLKDRYGVDQNDSLLENLAKIGIREKDIDRVIFSHLHFDHAGGLLSSYEDGTTRLRFPKAKYYLGASHWERACAPHVRERVSFIPILQHLLKESGRLVLIEKSTHPDLNFGVSFHVSNGHTIGLMLSQLDLSEGSLLFVADLIPGLPWMHLPITMGYDRYPELIVDEKRQHLDRLVQQKGKVFFTHDPHVACVAIHLDANGKYLAEPATI